ncbi:MAG: hypothetical protein ACI4YB_00745 [Oscillospiraceae bacterium]
MEYIICFVSSVIIIILTMIIACSARKNSSRIAIVGIIPAAALLFYPAGSGASLIEKINDVMAALFRSARVLLLGEDYSMEIFDFTGLPHEFVNIYVWVLTLLYLAAPILTFTVILSFLKDLREGIKLSISRKENVYLFSCLNENAVKTVKNLNKKGLYVFFESSEDDILSDELKKYKCSFLAGSITSVRKDLLSKPHSLTVYLNSEDENQNALDAAELIKRISVLRNKDDLPNSDMYAFTGQHAHELLLNAIPKKKVNLRRLDLDTMLAEHLIMSDKDIAVCFTDCIEGRGAEISLIGFDRFNEELFRCLSWFLQASEDKTVLKLNIYTDEQTKQQIGEKYPELVFAESLRDIPNCSINISSLYDPSKDNASIIFINFGNDIENITQAINIFEKTARVRNTDNLKIKIPIKQQSIFTDSANEGDVKPLHPINHKKQEYPIDFLFYDNVLGTEKAELVQAEKIAEKLYHSWNNEGSGTVYDFDFDYRSSMSSAVFWYMYVKLICNGSTPENNEKNRRIEHRRWVSFMRSEGYIYSANRNDAGKMHNCLDEWDALSDTVKDYDGLIIEAVGKLLK